MTTVYLARHGESDWNVERRRAFSAGDLSVIRKP